MKINIMQNIDCKQVVDLKVGEFIQISQPDGKIEKIISIEMDSTDQRITHLTLGSGKYQANTFGYIYTYEK